MNDDPRKDGDSVSLSAELRLDEACQRFEAAWKAGPAPRLDDYLGKATGAERVALLKELIRLDIAYRRQRGEAVRSADYLARFPELDAVWLEREMMPSTLIGTPRPPVVGEAVQEVTPPLASQATDAPPLLVPGYEILGELGRGGMGAVYKGRDPELGRELAVKILLERHHDDPRTVERFLEEAQVGGQLQHPGVVPVYEAGRLPDNRPYFTMKLVEGQTLSALLKERDAPARDLPRFLQIFQQICQALAYAHSKGVIHRDLKPANMMVGAFGELQVMDWGLAKVVRGRGVRTVRSEAAEAKSETGSVVGTPAYMAPEQACGDADGLDERCDVFGLGAILCEILTGAPPYRGKDVGELLRKAARAELTDVFERLDASGADADLVKVAKACLAAAPAARPRDAGAAAAAMTAYLAEVQERLRKAELAEAAAQARAEEERKRRRLTVALAATVLLAVTAAGAGALWYQQDRAARAAADAAVAAEHARKAAATERDATAALEEATAFAKQAMGLHDDPTKWEAALVEAQSAVKRAEGVLNNGVDDTGALRARVDAVLAELDAPERDRRMIARLEEARFQLASPGNEGGFDRTGAEALYAKAFREDGIDPEKLEPNEAAFLIEGRAIREELLAALAYWSDLTADKQEREVLRRVLQATDPDPNSFQNRWNTAVEQEDRDTMSRLGIDPEMRDQPTARLVIMADTLVDLGSAVEAVSLLKEANDRHPGDFWISFELAYASSETKPPASDEGIRYFTAALMLRPDSAITHSNLGWTLSDKGRFDEAIIELYKAIALQPDLALAHNNLGVALYDKGRLDEGITEYRKVLEIQPDLAQAHNNLGNALRDKGQLDEAVAECRKALQIQPDFALAHNNLGNALYDKHQPDEAIAEYRKALQIQPDLALAHNNLGNALRDKGRLDEAVAECRKALQIQPGLALAHNNLGLALQNKHQPDEAIAEFHRALQIQPDFALAHNNLGIALRDKGQLNAAVVEWRKALQIQPGLALAHNNLGNALREKHQPDEAITEYRKAIELNPDYAQAHYNLGVALRDKGQLDEAIAEFHRALQIQPDDAEAHNNLGVALDDTHQPNEAIAEDRKAIELNPDYAQAHYNLGVALGDKGQLDEAIAEFHRALQIQPDLAEAHNNLGNALREKHQLEEAITEYRKAIELNPDYAQTHYNLGNALDDKHQPDEAIAEYRKAIELNPDYAKAHNNLGLALDEKHQPDEAITEYRKAIKLNPDFAKAHYNLGSALRDKGQLDEAIAEFHRVLQIQPDDAEAHNNLALALQNKGQLNEAIAEFRKAIELKPDDFLAHSNLGVALSDKHQLDEAIAEFHKALQIQPEDAVAHNNLGGALQEKGRLDEAIVEFRKALQIQPDLAEAHSNLGYALYAKHQWDEAIAEYKKALQIRPDDAVAHNNLGLALDLAERDAVLPAILRGEAAPADAAQQIRFADFCQEYKRLYATASRFYADAFTAEPGLAEDLASGARYNAACAAAQAGCGQGEDAAKTDAKERSHWRKQALDWLRANLTLWTKRTSEGKPEDRAEAAKILSHWQEDSDLAGVRDKDALAKLPPDEQDAWRKLWADVDALLKKAQQK